MRKLILIVIILTCLLASASGQVSGAERTDMIRVNLGGLFIGPWTGVYGLDVAYEHILGDWLGWNLSVWGLNNLTVWGMGIGTSVDLFLTGDAPSGLFLNARSGVVFGEVYGTRSTSLQIGMSAGFQNVWQNGFVFRIGTGGSYVVGQRLLPRALVSVGYAF